MINFTSLSNFPTPFISFFVCVSPILLSAFHCVQEDKECIMHPNSIFFSTHCCTALPLPLSFHPVQDYLLYITISVTEKLQDERWHHHIFAQNILMPLDCMCCLDRHIALMMTPSQFFFAFHFFFSKNINCIFMDFRLSHLHGFKKKRHGTECT